MKQHKQTDEMEPESKGRRKKCEDEATWVMELVPSQLFLLTYCFQQSSKPTLIWTRGAPGLGETRQALDTRERLHPRPVAPRLLHPSAPWTIYKGGRGCSSSSGGHQGGKAMRGMGLQCPHLSAGPSPHPQLQKGQSRESMSLAPDSGLCP